MQRYPGFVFLISSKSVIGAAWDLAQKTLLFYLDLHKSIIEQKKSKCNG